MEMVEDKTQPIVENEHGLNLEQELFCQYYTKNREVFGSAVQSYALAYGYDLDILSKEKPVLEIKENGTKIFGTSEYEKAYSVCGVNGSRLLKLTKINARVQKLLNELLTEEFVDSELAKVVAQDYKPDAKIRAINEFNKVKGRHAPEKVDHGKLTIEIMDYAKGNTNPDTIPVRAEAIPVADTPEPSAVHGTGDAPESRKDEDNPQPADPEDDASGQQEGFIHVSVPAVQPSEEGNLAGSGDDAALPEGDRGEEERLGALHQD